jgi:hypothetical protein
VHNTIPTREFAKPLSVSRSNRTPKPILLLMREHVVDAVPQHRNRRGTEQDGGLVPDRQHRGGATAFWVVREAETPEHTRPWAHVGPPER